MTVEHSMAGPEDDVAPSKWRRRQGGVARSDDQLVDAEGNIGVPWLTHDTLDRMLAAGTIDQAMHEAGRQFHGAFQKARLEPLHSPDLRRIPGQHTRSAEHVEDLKAEIHEAVRVLGGHGSPAGACAWWVIGCELTLQKWAEREGWQGKRLKRETASGILIGALGCLAEHYKLVDGRVARATQTS